MFRRKAAMRRFPIFKRCEEQLTEIQKAADHKSVLVNEADVRTLITSLNC